MRALVTGCTGNVGEACIDLFMLNGWEVVGVARNCEDGPRPTALYSADLSRPLAIHDFLMNESNFDLVVMTHGTQHGVTIGDPAFESWYLEIVANNLTSAVHLTNHLIFNKQLNPGALIVYCSSIHATQPRKARGPYAIAKAGLEALARVVAIEQSGNGIRAVALRLGQLSKPMVGISFTPEQLESIRQCTLIDWPTPEEIAKLCLALYEQKGLTGEIINLDSGHRLNVWP